MNANESILLCWHSTNHGLPVLENAIKALRNRKVAVKKVLYLMQASQHLAQRDLVAGVPVEPISISVEDPTNHEAIYRTLREQLLPRIQDAGELHINVSPGTPAMHAVWMVLHAGGAFPDGTRLWSSQFDPTTRRTRVDSVDFSISTYLAEIRRFARVRPDLAVYEPEAKSAARHVAFERLRRYASLAGAPLLLLGERGTGKTRLVETFVGKLKRRKPIVTVPCGGLDSTLAESALFGHLKGSFTGAVADRAGFLKQAHHGILFLDEVQDLPHTAQRKLVRTLQDRERRFRSVGSDEEVTADFELVCASNLPVEKLRERLDADFFDRLSHLTVSVPPLRACREDLRDDWGRVWSEMRCDTRLATEAVWNNELQQLLEVSSLPGNLRDLQRLALLMMAFSDGLPAEEAFRTAITEWKQPIGDAVDHPQAFGRGTRRERVDWFCARLARWAQGRYGTWTAAAQALGCDEKTLRLDAGRELDAGT